MKIRKATMKDAKIILKLLKSESVMTGNDELYYDLKHAKEYIRGKSFVTFVYEEDKNIVGLVSINLFNIGKYAEIYNVIVDKNYRKKGMGLKLMQFAEKYLKNKGYEIAYFYVEGSNKPMQNFARKIKYERGKMFRFYSKIFK